MNDLIDKNTQRENQLNLKKVKPKRVKTREEKDESNSSSSGEQSEGSQSSSDTDSEETENSDSEESKDEKMAKDAPKVDKLVKKPGEKNKLPDQKVEMDLTSKIGGVISRGIRTAHKEGLDAGRKQRRFQTFEI